MFVLNWARVRRVGRRSISTELLMCGGDVRSILLLPLVARCIETIDVCICTCLFLCCSDWSDYCLAAVVEKSGFLVSEC